MHSMAVTGGFLFHLINSKPQANLSALSTSLYSLLRITNCIEHEQTLSTHILHGKHCLYGISVGCSEVGLLIKLHSCNHADVWICQRPELQFKWRANEWVIDGARSDELSAKMPAVCAGLRANTTGLQHSNDEVITVTLIRSPTNCTSPSGYH
jgi:hypothetical protein